jgi:hypothetical protein
VNYLNSLLETIVELPSETEWVEFKENNENIQEIGEYLSTISNFAPFNTVQHTTIYASAVLDGAFKDSNRIRVTVPWLSPMSKWRYAWRETPYWAVGAGRRVAYSPNLVPASTLTSCQIYFGRQPLASLLSNEDSLNQESPSFNDRRKDRV